MISFCTRGTCSSGISSPRSPRATITPCATLENRRRDSPPPPAARSSRSAARRAPASAITSPAPAARRRPSARSSARRDPRRARGRTADRPRPSSVTADGGQRDARRVDALVLAEPAARHDDRDQLVGRACSMTRSSMRPSSSSSRSPGLRRAHQLGVRREDPARLSPGTIAGRDAQLVSLAQGKRLAAASGPVRIFGPLRSCMIGDVAPGSARRLADRAIRSRRATRGSRARN